MQEELCRDFSLENGTFSALRRVTCRDPAVDMRSQGSQDVLPGRTESRKINGYDRDGGK